MKLGRTPPYRGEERGKSKPSRKEHEQRRRKTCSGEKGKEERSKGGKKPRRRRDHPKTLSKDQ